MLILLLASLLAIQRKPCMMRKRAMFTSRAQGYIFTEDMHIHVTIVCICTKCSSERTLPAKYELVHWSSPY